jgi:hypothetical protein
MKSFVFEAWEETKKTDLSILNLLLSLEDKTGKFEAFSNNFINSQRAIGSKLLRFN